MGIALRTESLNHVTAGKCRNGRGESISVEYWYISSHSWLRQSVEMNVIYQPTKVYVISGDYMAV